jgi:hypothetical protein
MARKAKGPGGRPTTFSDKIAAVLCARMAEGESLRSICRNADMPGLSTVFQWLKAQPGFADQYAIAREAQADALFEDVLEIADDARNDWMEAFGEDAVGYKLNGEHIQRSRLRIDARKWMAGKLRPKVYGEKSVVEGPGPHGEHLHKVGPDEAFQRLASRLGGAAPGSEGGDPSAE